MKIALILIILFLTHFLMAAPIRVRVSSEVNTIDWNQSNDATSLLVIFQLMRGLVRIDDQNKVVPDLAKSWTLSKDKKTILFEIQKNVLWSDGVALTSQNFVDSIDRVRDTKVASPVAHYFNDIENAVSIDDKHFKIILKKPASYLLALLSHPSVYPIRQDLIYKYGKLWTLPENLVVLGPYKLTKNGDQKIELVKNGSSYLASKDSSDIEIIVINEDRTAVDLFDAKKIDLVLNVSSQEITQRKTDIDIHPIDRVVGILLNQNVSPFNNKLVRQAFEYATSRSQLLKIFRIGQQATSLWLPISMGYPQKEVFDSEKAKEFLAKAGYKDGKGLPPIRLSLPSKDDAKILGAQLQSQWKEILGVQVELQMSEFKTYLSELNNSPQALSYISWGTSYPDPLNFLEVFAADSFTKKLWFKPEYNNLVEKYKIESSQIEKQKVLQAAEKILTETEIVVLPLFNEVQSILKSPQIDNFKLNNGRLDFQKLKKLEIN